MKRKLSEFKVKSLVTDLRYPLNNQVRGGGTRYTFCESYCASGCIEACEDTPMC
ncbi:MAG: hypothetical protein WBB45_20160 [Cyclobacteriaceae bacterium]